MPNKHTRDESRTSDEAVDRRDRIQPDTTGRALSIDAGPEDRLMQIDTIDTAETTDPVGRSRKDDFDDRAADEARMDVRRREHSAD
jgi:hypothetical protein